MILHLTNDYHHTKLYGELLNALNESNSNDGKSKHFAIVINNKDDYYNSEESVINFYSLSKFDRFFFNHKSKKSFKAISSYFYDNKIDLIHAHFLFTNGSVAYRFFQRNDTKYILSVRNTDVNLFFRYFPHLRTMGIKYMINSSAIVFLSTEYCKKVFAKYIPERYKDELLSKTYIIPNGINDYWHRNTPVIDYDEVRAKFSNKKLDILYIGTINKNKNIGTTQKSLTLLRKKGWKINLTLVGSVSDEKEFRNIMSDTHTVYVEQQPREKLLQYYRNSDIFVMPSHHETFGLVYAEAMSQGLPIIYSKGQGFDGLFPEGLVGYSVDSRSPSGISDAIELIINNYQTISENCLSHASIFSWKKIANDYNKLYKQILAEIALTVQ